MLINNKNDDGEHIYLDEEPDQGLHFILQQFVHLTYPVCSMSLVTTIDDFTFFFHLTKSLQVGSRLIYSLHHPEISVTLMIALASSLIKQNGTMCRLSPNLCSGRVPIGWCHGRVSRKQLAAIKISKSR